MLPAARPVMFFISMRNFSRCTPQVARSRGAVVHRLPAVLGAVLGPDHAEHQAALHRGLGEHDDGLRVVEAHGARLQRDVLAREGLGGDVLVEHLDAVLRVARRRLLDAADALCRALERLANLGTSAVRPACCSTSWCGFEPWPGRRRRCCRECGCNSRHRSRAAACTGGSAARCGTRKWLVPPPTCAATSFFFSSSLCDAELMCWLRLPL